MAEEASPISFEDLSLIEAEFDEIDNQILRTQYELSRKAYAKRTATVAQIPKFWPLVFEQAPGEIDRYITPNDSRILGDSLLSLEVIRPELEPPSSADPTIPFTPAPTASPRSLTIRFTFAENPDFADRVLEKHFWYRRAADGWTGLVSEPVRIAWKAGQDPTEGLTDGARDVWEVRSKRGDWRATDFPEYAALKDRVEHWNGLNTSFFTWFGWVSGRRWVSAEESEEANRVEREKKEARGKKDGKAAEEDEEDEEVEEEDDEEIDVFEDGEDLVVSLADDLWPNAIKFFVAAQESEEIFSELDFEELDDEDDEDDDEDAEPVDMRELLKENGHARKASGSGGPPTKKQKK